MAEWLEQASQWPEMYCHDLEVMSSNPSQVKLGVFDLGCVVLLLNSYLIKKYFLHSSTTANSFYSEEFKLNVNILYFI